METMVPAVERARGGLLSCWPLLMVMITTAASTSQPSLSHTNVRGLWRWLEWGRKRSLAVTGGTHADSLMLRREV